MKAAKRVNPKSSYKEKQLFSYFFTFSLRVSLGVNESLKGSTYVNLVLFAH